MSSLIWRIISRGGLLLEQLLRIFFGFVAALVFVCRSSLNIIFPESWLPFLSLFLSTLKVLGSVLALIFGLSLLYQAFKHIF